MKRFLTIILLVIAFLILKTLYQAGQFKKITGHFDGEVSRIYHNMPGPEDIQMDYLTGNLFISASNRRPDNTANSKDGIYLLATANDDAPRLLKNDIKSEFHPHGISLLRADSTVYLFAVNHTKKGEFVESFRFDNNQLFHLASYSSEKLCCPNDLVATDINKFYVSNDHGSKRGIMRMLEDYLRIPRASLLYFNGESFSKAAGPFNYANGVNVSSDRKTLYLTATTGNSLLVFSIDSNDELHRERIIDLATGVDNIDVDKDGNLWIAAHPKLLDFVKHVKDSINLSPSQVLKLSPVEDYNFSVEEIYLNDGSEVSASSVAVYYQNQLFIGTVLNHTLLRAKLKN